MPELFALCSLAVLGGPIIFEAAKGLVRGKLNVDELVSLAIIACVAIGEYFPAAVVAFIMVLGSLLEEFTAQKARFAIDSLIRLAPEKAVVLRGEEEVLVPVKELQLGERLLIRTGDEHRIAAHIAKKIGITEYYAEILPEEKLKQVKELQQNNFKVAMVGDGINDAPSLAAADIGISMGAMGTDAAIEASDAALMGDDITKVPYFLNLGRLTVQTIKFNIIFAMIFNILALVASGAGFLNPVTGALAHNIGSVIVVINSAGLIKKLA